MFYMATAHFTIHTEKLQRMEIMYIYTIPSKIYSVCPSHTCHIKYSSLHTVDPHNDYIYKQLINTSVDYGMHYLCIVHNQVSLFIPPLLYIQYYFHISITSHHRNTHNNEYMTYSHYPTSIYIHISL